MSRCFLVRHGETAWNLEGRAQGHADTPLNDNGQRQMKLLATRLETTRFAAAYSSDLSRCLDGARLLLEGSGTSLSVAPELRELSYGALEGMTYGEVQLEDPSLYAQLMEGDIAFAPPGGESVESLMRRVKMLGERLVKDHSGGEAILVVAHSGSIRALLLTLLELPVKAFWRFQLGTGSLSIVNLFPEGATLELWNDTCHLEYQDDE